MTSVEGAFGICTCTEGPVLLSDSDELTRKFVVSIADYDKSKHRSAIFCKVTSKNIEKPYMGEFIIDDFFGRGKSKVQPYNIVRVPQTDLDNHRHIGLINDAHHQSFELGLKIAVQRRILNPSEILRVADSWSHILPNLT